MSVIKISNLTFAYEGSLDNIFENVSFQIDTDWKLGFTGRNGRGKTTFLKLLQKEYPYEGKIYSSSEFEYFPYRLFDTDNYVIDVIRETAFSAADWQIRKELSLLGLDEDILYRQFFTLSEGEQTKAMLAALFLKENAFLLIDEPTNHLDIQGRKQLSQYLNTKKGFILVSHDRTFMDGCIDHILSIHKTNIEIQKGNFSSWFYNKTLQDKNKIAENKKIKKDIKHLTDAVQRTSKWSDKIEKSKNGTLISGVKADKGHIGHKSAKMMQRSKSIQRRQKQAIDDKKGLLENIENTDDISINPESYFKSRLVFIDHAAVSYGEKTVCKHITFEINQGDRIALIGKNGSGKSSILKLVSGEITPSCGNIIKGGKLNISYISQNTDNLKGTPDEYSASKNIDKTQFFTILRKLDFSRIQLEKDMSSYSSGQKKKVLIAESLCRKANLYIWDEPLNFVDIISRIQIENLIVKHKPTILFVEHDISFVEKTATKIIEIK